MGIQSHGDSTSQLRAGKSSFLLPYIYSISRDMAPFPEIKSKHSLVAKHVTEEKWNKLNEIVSKTSQFTLAKAIACAVEFDNQHCGIYAGDEDSYVDFADVFDPLICEYHGLSADFKHTSYSPSHEANRVGAERRL